MKTLSISDFKSTCIAELKGVQASGEPLEITLRGHPIAHVVPIAQPKRVFGTQKGALTILTGEDQGLEGEFDDREVALITAKPRVS